MTRSYKRGILALSLAALAALIAVPRAVGSLAKQTRPWPTNTIHYVIETTNPCNGKPAVCGSCTGLNNEEAAKVRTGLDELEAYTPLKFVPGIAAGERYITYRHDYCVGNGKTSILANGNTLITFAGFNNRTVLHETGHAIGMAHEQTRGDRDQFVTFHPECLPPPQDDTQKQPWAFRNWADGWEAMAPFDFSSVMLYDSFSKSRDATCNTVNGRQVCCPTMLKNSSNVTYRYNGVDIPGDLIVSDEDHLSIEDVNTIAQMYPPKLGLNEAGDHYGRSMAAGDFDGDGYQDLAVGVPDEKINGVRSGSVFLYKGTYTGLVPWKRLSQAGLATAGSNDRFGEVLLAADLDGDKIAELIVGAPGKTISIGVAAPASGSVFVFHGSRSGPTASGGHLLDPHNSGFDGTNRSGDLFGAALAAGNFDGAGKLDLAVGAPGRESGAGRVFVWHWEAALGGDRLVKFVQLGLQSHPGDGFGSSLAAASLLPVRGSDLIVGSPESLSPNPGSGSIYVFLGGPGGMPAAGQIRQPAAGSRHGDDFGATVAAGRFGAGQQVVVGAPGRGAGLVYILKLRQNGSTFEIDHSFDFGEDLLAAPTNGDRFGSVLAVADIDGDGLDDIAAGVPDKFLKGVHTDGFVLLFHGAPDSVNPWQLYRQPTSYPPVTSGDRFGASLATGIFDRPSGGLIGLAMGSPGKYTEAGAFYVAQGRKRGAPYLSTQTNPDTVATPPAPPAVWDPGFWTFFTQELTNSR